MHMHILTGSLSAPSGCDPHRGHRITGLDFMFFYVFLCFFMFFLCFFMFFHVFLCLYMFFILTVRYLLLISKIFRRFKQSFRHLIHAGLSLKDFWLEHGNGT